MILINVIGYDQATLTESQHYETMYKGIISLSKE